MSATGKRLDLRFGAFACSVHGFDDPVQPVQQILRAIQHLLEESPELSDTGINFDAEAIEQLVGEVARRAELDENEVEIIPGLVIIHHGAGGDLRAGDAPAARISDGDQEPAGSSGGDSGGAYVNIFTPSGGAAGEGADDGVAASPEEDAEEGTGGDAAAGQEDFEDRLRQMAAGGDEYGWAEDEEEIREAGAGAAEDDKDADDDDEEPLNLFAGEVPAEGEPDEQAETSAGGDATVRNLFSPGTQGEPAAWDPDAGEDEGAGTGEAAADVSAAALATRAEAESVPELMVASAAWMVLTQGQTSFTRRDVLDVFETIPGDHETTPEARIKGFGKAVRNGQLVATSDGIFGLSRSELERFQELL